MDKFVPWQIYTNEVLSKYASRQVLYNKNSLSEESFTRRNFCNKKKYIILIILILITFTLHFRFCFSSLERKFFYLSWSEKYSKLRKLFSSRKEENRRNFRNVGDDLVKIRNTKRSPFPHAHQWYPRVSLNSGSSVSRLANPMTCSRSILDGISLE